MKDVSGKRHSGGSRHGISAAIRSDARLRADAAKDPDTYFPSMAEWAEAAIVLPKRKVPVGLRLDEDVIAYFKARGRGHLTRMAGVLRAYVALQTARSLRAATGSGRGRRRAPARKAD